MRRSEQLVPSLDVVQRTLSADSAYTISRMQVLEKIPGNPIGVAYRWIDSSAVALMSRLPAFSRVVGLRAGHERQIEPLVNWYSEHGVKPTFEMIPGHYDPSLGSELARLGYYQSGFHASLIGEPSRAGDGEAEIEAVTTAEAMEDYSTPMWPDGALPRRNKPNSRSMCDRGSRRRDGRSISHG